MFDSFKQYIFSNKIIQIQKNFLFISFIFLSGLKYDFYQIRFLILILLLPCGFYIINDCANKNFKNITIFFSFIFILITHSFLNIYFENSIVTKYNLFGIFFLTIIFIISYYFYEYFNSNILNITKFFYFYSLVQSY